MKYKGIKIKLTSEDGYLFTYKFTYDGKEYVNGCDIGIGSEDEAKGWLLQTAMDVIDTLIK